EKASGFAVTVQSAACATVTACPATVSVPFRAAPGFAATVKVTEPAPVPLSPELMVIHEALLAAAQAQVLPVVTVTTCPVAPVAGMEETAVGFTVTVHSAAWFTVTTCPATVSAPL